MHTLCPECKKLRLISAEELRKAQGMVRCTGCSAMFDALEFLNAKQETEKSKSSSQVYIKAPTTSILNKLTPYWGLGYTFCICLFVFQLYLFEGYNITQNKTVRPWLEKSCDYIDCKLPIYKNLGEFTILHGSFEPSENMQYTFKTSFTNQADFEQKPPSIKLTLLDFTGHSFAERTFHPKDYLKQAISIIKPEMSAEITMQIAAPAQSIGGYRFEFI